ncbi:MAG: hypothetical protein KJP22_02665 [Acidimicrobiia bacterium]|nr:hypothetical protein [Acidimicrobiia bacterium]MBT8192277.1 hypothetical protein [Acidimicrobiia bacterium]MBT8247656.1 hypothetical protein [Acidimicrobiia bacterium]NNF88812.1 hypothetical protein [Acidimicrobiia bacterium]NNJ48655.1 hypothetical protein [Acidimicrobiia bacterium]
MEKRLKEKVAKALEGVLGPNEELLIGSNGLHPRLTSGAGFYLTALIGALGGSLLQSTTGRGPEALAPAAGIGFALVVRWLIVYRSRSDAQPAGAIPLIGLTDQRLIYVATDFWGRPTGSREEWPIEEIENLFVKNRLLGLPNAVLEATDGRTIHYQIRYGHRVAAEIERLQGGKREAGSG